MEYEHNLTAADRVPLLKERQEAGHKGSWQIIFQIQGPRDERQVDYCRETYSARRSYEDICQSALHHCKTTIPNQLPPDVRGTYRYFFVVEFW